MEAIGLVKFDFLGLATLTILEIAKEFIVRRHKGQEHFAFENIPLDDGPTYRLFSEGKTEAVFQFESRGMQGMLKEARPSRLEDLIALNALYRPGPMDLIPSFVARKHGKEVVEYPHPLVEPVLAEIANDELIVDLRSGSYAGLGRIPSAVRVQVLAEHADGHRTVVSHFNKAHKGRLARALATSRAEPDDAAKVAAIARRAGMTVERAGNDLTVIVPA